MTLAFREAQDVNLENVVNLWKACELTRPWNDPYKDIQFAREGATSTVLVGILDDRIVASVMVGHDGHRGVIYYLAVDPAFRKRGYGKAAVAAGETCGRSISWCVTTMRRQAASMNAWATRSIR